MPAEIKTNVAELRRERQKSRGISGNEDSLPPDAVRKRDTKLSAGVRLSVHLSHSCSASNRIKISSNFLRLVAIIVNYIEIYMRQHI